MGQLHRKLFHFMMTLWGIYVWIWESHNISYLLDKTKAEFVWILWHWSSCFKLIKIHSAYGTHRLWNVNWPCETQLPKISSTWGLDNRGKYLHYMASVYMDVWIYEAPFKMQTCKKVQYLKTGTTLFYWITIVCCFIECRSSQTVLTRQGS